MKKKNKEMLEIFWRAWKKEKEAINLVIPKQYVKNIFTIDYEKLKFLGIKNIVFDIDNTIMPVNETYVEEELIKFFDKLKKDFTICLFSNNEEKRVKPVIEKLKVKGIWNSEKPSKTAYKKLQAEVGEVKNNTAIVGDQMLTDIVFGNTYKLYTILVEPYKKKYDIKTGTSRILQNILMKRIPEIKRYHYY